MENTNCISLESIGPRQKSISKHLYEMVSSEAAAQQSPAPPLVDYTSATHADYMSKGMDLIAHCY